MDDDTRNRSQGHDQSRDGDEASRKLRKLLIGEFSLKRLLRSTIIIYICLLIFAHVWSEWMIYCPQPPSYTDTAEIPDTAPILKIPTADGLTISALHMINPKAEYTVLYSHGNAVDLGDIRQLMENYRSQGFSVFSYDYHGYGTSDGRPSTKNVYLDADAALRYLTEQKQIPPQRIIIHGRSLGGGPALYLAHKSNVAGLIVESAFVTAYRVMTHIPLFPFDKFRNISLIDEVNCPVLVIHGRRDRTIPFWHGQALFDRARAPKMNCWLDETDHDYIPSKARKTYWAAVQRFVKEMVISP